MTSHSIELAMLLKHLRHYARSGRLAQLSPISFRNSTIVIIVLGDS